MPPEQLPARRAAVCSLGTTQDKLCGEFQQRMAAVRQGQEPEHLRIAASFGNGKSYLLQSLDHLASEAGFVTCQLDGAPWAGEEAACGFRTRRNVLSFCGL